MRIRKSTAAVVAGTVLGGSVLAGAGTLAAAPAQAAPLSNEVSAQDTTWAQGNAQTDLAEIAIGQLAEQRAQHATTKSFAQTTISDHQKALSALKSVAAKTGIKLPTAPNATQQAQAAQLEKVASAQFDVTYDSIQIQGHELSISQTQTEIADGTSTAVVDFAQVYLPVAEKHLQMAESGYASLTGSSGAPGVSAGTGGMAAVRPADDSLWLGLGAAGLLLIAGSGVAGVRRLRLPR